jgi:hypothetical protein
VTTDEDLYQTIDDLLAAQGRVAGLYLASRQGQQVPGDYLTGMIDCLLVAQTDIVELYRKLEAELATLRTSVQPAGLSAETVANDVAQQRQIAEAWRKRAEKAEAELEKLRSEAEWLSDMVEDRHQWLLRAQAAERELAALLPEPQANTGIIVGGPAVAFTTTEHLTWDPQP